MTARVGLTAGTYPEEEEQIRFWENAARRASRRSPASTQQRSPISLARVTAAMTGRCRSRAGITAMSRPGPSSIVTASPSYFETFRHRRPAGAAARQPRSRGLRCKSLVVNETMAREMLPDDRRSARASGFDLDEDEGWRTVVGVVPGRHSGRRRRDRSRPRIPPVSQTPERFMSIAVRGEGDPRALIGAMRTALAQTDPDLALYWLRTFDEVRVIRPPASASSARCSPCSPASRSSSPPPASSVCWPSTSASARARSACGARSARTIGAILKHDHACERRADR